MRRTMDYIVTANDRNEQLRPFCPATGDVINIWRVSSRSDVRVGNVVNADAAKRDTIQHRGAKIVGIGRTLKIVTNVPADIQVVGAAADIKGRAAANCNFVRRRRASVCLGDVAVGCGNRQTVGGNRLECNRAGRCNNQSASADSG